MSHGSHVQGKAAPAMVDPPSWAQCFMALAGAVLLVGPTLAVLWPR